MDNNVAGRQSKRSCYGIPPHGPLYAPDLIAPDYTPSANPYEDVEPISEYSYETRETGYPSGNAVYAPPSSLPTNEATGNSCGEAQYGPQYGFVTNGYPIGNQYYSRFPYESASYPPPSYARDDPAAYDLYENVEPASYPGFATGATTFDHGNVEPTPELEFATSAATIHQGNIEATPGFEFADHDLPSTRYPSPDFTATQFSYPTGPNNQLQYQGADLKWNPVEAYSSQIRGPATFNAFDSESGNNIDPSLNFTTGSQDTLDSAGGVQSGNEFDSSYTFPMESQDSFTSVDDTVQSGTLCGCGDTTGLCVCSDTTLMGSQHIFDSIGSVPSGDANESLSTSPARSQDSIDSMAGSFGSGSSSPVRIRGTSGTVGIVKSRVTRGGARQAPPRQKAVRTKSTAAPKPTPVAIAEVDYDPALLDPLKEQVSHLLQLKDLVNADDLKALQHERLIKNNSAEMWNENPAIRPRGKVGGTARKNRDTHGNYVYYAESKKIGQDWLEHRKEVEQKDLVGRVRIKGLDALRVLTKEVKAGIDEQLKHDEEMVRYAVIFDAGAATPEMISDLNKIHETVFGEAVMKKIKDIEEMLSVFRLEYDETLI